MSELAYYSGYVGSSNIPAIQLASKLMSLAYPNLQAVFFTSGGAESNESAFKTARFYWKMFEPRVPNFVHIPTCYPYRQECAQPGETAGQTAARLLDEAIVREGA